MQSPGSWGILGQYFFFSIHAGSPWGIHDLIETSGVSGPSYLHSSGLYLMRRLEADEYFLMQGDPTLTAPSSALSSFGYLATGMA
jgi:hypothetical protein